MPHQIIKLCLYLIPLIIVITIIKSAWFKGKVGEFIVNLALKIFLNKDRYKILKNVTLPIDNKTTQIDHIIVSKFGIFVIETKNMKGWIYGSEKQKSWTQKIFKHTSKFQNPLHQNYKHIKTLQTLLNLKESQLHSVIVFIGDSTFKTKMPENVFNGIKFIRYIKSKKEKVLSQAQIEHIIYKIQTLRLKPSLKTDLQHIKLLNQQKYKE